MRNKTILPQQQQLQQFITDQKIVDVYTVDANNSILPAEPHQLIVCIINPHDLISMQSVDSMITELKPYAANYYYIAVNKFLIYTEQDMYTKLDGADVDLQLIEHWTKLINLKVVWAASRSDDRGHLGNFVHPVTNIMFEL